MTTRFTLVIPCFNEEKSLMQLIPELIDIVSKKDIDFILVDNGSSDDTYKLLTLIANPKITVINIASNAGYGGGIKAGLNCAQGEYIGWIHADLQYSMNEVVEDLFKIPSNADYIKGRRLGRTLFQNLISLHMSLFETFIFRYILYDINAQPTVFRRIFVNELHNLPEDFSIDLYSYVLAKKFKLNIVRFDVNFLKRSYGKSSWNFGFNSLIKMSLQTIKYSISLKKDL